MIKAKRNYSLILKRDVNVLRDHIGRTKAAFDFCATVSDSELIKILSGDLELRQLDKDLSGGSGVQALITRDFFKTGLSSG
ncbi:hypothetical protein [Bradyrhizobium sp. LMTR 3]|uniref:hypothetical protein n=1 Tax=Bradyrhizobium sp. LMTR 3 TaxID=189873 RepID=UPI000810C056|nr:hypothetical protein [Bradyrhizobium sp. LMTR 3]OCK53840.1 hypothetical protein LMTR3_21730 [Bradyrhizobium sp. LMTR 3]